MANKQEKMPTASRGGRKLRNDLIFVTALVLAVSLLGLFFYYFREEGDSVVVEVDGKVYGVYALSEDRTVEIRTGENGEDLNRLVIRDGRAYMEEATCPDGICVSHRSVHREGESIVCLPHRVVVTVRISGGQDSPDIVI